MFVFKLWHSKSKGDVNNKKQKTVNWTTISVASRYRNKTNVLRLHSLSSWRNDDIHLITRINTQVLLTFYLHVGPEFLWFYSEQNLGKFGRCLPPCSNAHQFARPCGNRFILPCVPDITRPTFCLAGWKPRVLTERRIHYLEVKGVLRC